MAEHVLGKCVTIVIINRGVIYVTMVQFIVTNVSIGVFCASRCYCCREFRFVHGDVGHAAHVGLVVCQVTVSDGFGISNSHVFTAVGDRLVTDCDIVVTTDFVLTSNGQYETVVMVIFGVQISGQWGQRRIANTEQHGIPVVRRILLAHENGVGGHFAG